MFAEGHERCRRRCDEDQAACAYVTLCARRIAMDACTWAVDASCHVWFKLEADDLPPLRARSASVSTSQHPHAIHTTSLRHLHCTILALLCPSRSAPLSAQFVPIVPVKQWLSFKIADRATRPSSASTSKSRSTSKVCARCALTTRSSRIVRRSGSSEFAISRVNGLHSRSDLGGERPRDANLLMGQMRT